MAPGNSGSGEGASGAAASEASHWVQWHEPYEDAASPISLRLRLVQEALRGALGEAPAGPVRVVSLCAGQGRDVIDVVAESPRRTDVQALLVELDPALVAFARRRAEERGVGEQVEVLEGDASLAHHYAANVPAQIVVVCGVFGNISEADIHRTIETVSGWCTPGASVVWTRHRRDPDLTPTIRGWFAAAGFEEASFGAPDGYLLSVGRHRLGNGGVTGSTTITPPPFDPTIRLFDFVGDGWRPA
jgi:putative methyltransferase